MGLGNKLLKQRLDPRLTSKKRRVLYLIIEELDNFNNRLHPDIFIILHFLLPVTSFRTAPKMKTRRFFDF